MLENEPPGLMPLAEHVVGSMRWQYNGARPEPGPPPDPLEQENSRLRRQLGHLREELRKAVELEEKWESGFNALWDFVAGDYSGELLRTLCECKDFPQDRMSDVMLNAREILMPELRKLQPLQLLVMSRKDARAQEMKHGAPWWLRDSLL